jgi:cytolysin (calcineurin-like family phosphatase)
VRINPSFSIDEHAQVLAAAGRAGLTPTGFVAQAALAAARDETSTMTFGETSVAVAPPSSAEYEALRDVQAALFDACTAVNRVGVNLNQAVAALNATGQPPVWLETVVTMCARRLAALDEVVTAVHHLVTNRWLR